LGFRVPDNVAEEVGMKELFKAIRTNSCGMYHCSPKEKKDIEKRTDDDEQKSKLSEISKKTSLKKPTKIKKFIRN